MSQQEMTLDVAHDLAYIRSGWGQDVDDATMRRDTAVLRRLLVDGQYQRAWKQAGFPKEPVIRALGVDSVALRIPKQNMIYAAAGGGFFRGAAVGGTVIIGDMSKEEIDAYGSDPIKEEDFGLRAFCKTPCIVISGEQVPRHALIKYVANKLGGVHFDAGRKQTQEEMLYTLLDLAAQDLEILSKNAVYFELLSIGQALGRAESTRLFVEHVLGSCPGLTYPQAPAVSPENRAPVFPLPLMTPAHPKWVATLKPCMVEKVGLYPGDRVYHLKGTNLLAAIFGYMDAGETCDQAMIVAWDPTQGFESSAREMRGVPFADLEHTPGVEGPVGKAWLTAIT